MYEVVNQTPKAIVLTYIVFMTACFATYPIIRLIMTAVAKGLSKWR